MLRRFAILLVVSSSVIALLSAALAAEAVFPPGSRIGLAPAGDLVVAKKFVGFEDASRDVAVTVLDIPGPAYQAFEKSAFADKSKSLKTETRELFAFASGVGFLVTGQENVKGTDYRSWYLLANTADKQAGQIAALVGVRVPEAARSVYTDEKVRAMLATVQFRMPPMDELVRLLPFKVTNMAGFRLAKVAPQGAMILIDGPSDNLTKYTYIIVSVGRGAPNQAESRPNFARDLLERTPLPGLAVTSAESMRINGSQGYEIRAKAKAADGKPLALVQWLQFAGGNSFLRLVGVVEQDSWDAVFPRFRALRDGVEIR
jgi:hypothetical protein